MQWQDEEKEEEGDISTMTTAAAFIAQSELTRTYVKNVLELLINGDDTSFTLGQHERIQNISESNEEKNMDRALLQKIASHILARLKGRTTVLDMDAAFDAAIMKSVSENEATALKKSTRDQRMDHYFSTCKRTLTDHKNKIRSIAPSAAYAAEMTTSECEEFAKKIRLHDFSKLALPPWFCATCVTIVPVRHRSIGLVDFKKPKVCPFHRLMFCCVQMHRILEPTHHPSVLKQTSGRLKKLAEEYVRASAQGKLAALEIVCDTIEASLSRRCLSAEEGDPEKVNPWIHFAHDNFTPGKPQEIPNDLFRNMLIMLFPKIASESATNEDIMEKVSRWSTVEVRKESRIFDAIYKAHEQGVR